MACKNLCMTFGSGWPGCFFVIFYSIHLLFPNDDWIKAKDHVVHEELTFLISTPQLLGVTAIEQKIFNTLVKMALAHLPHSSLGSCIDLLPPVDNTI